MKLKITVLVLVAGVHAPASAEAANKRACAAKGSDTVLASKHARVFYITKRKGDPLPD